MRKFRTLYSSEIIKCSSQGLYYFEDENGFLFSEMRYPTKIKKADLPEYFVNGDIYHVNGFISAKGVKHLVYCPNYNINHWLKDDLLYISYDKEITFKKNGIFTYSEGNKYVISGEVIIDFIDAVEKYSYYDVSKIKKEIKLHLLFYKARYDNNLQTEIYPEIEIKKEELQELLDKKEYTIDRRYIR